MKKTLIILITTILTFTLVGCGGPKTYDEINYNELETMIKNKEDFILFIGAESCSACEAYRITVNKLVENNKVDIKYIDNDKLSDDEYSELMANFYTTSTPTTILVKKGKETDRIVGNQKYSKVEKTLKEKGYIE